MAAYALLVVSAVALIAAVWFAVRPAKLSTVATSLKTVSARAISYAMIDGESNARVLAEMAKGRMRRKTSGTAHCSLLTLSKNASSVERDPSSAPT